jgi:hypothetical protein
MAGTITFTQSDSGQIRRVVATCTADASNGSFPATALPVLEGVIVGLYTNPGSPAPTDNYDITLVDGDGVDRLGGLGADRDTSTSERVALAIPVDSSDSLTLTPTGNSVNSAVTVVTIEYTDNPAAVLGALLTQAPLQVGSRTVKVPVTPTLDTSAYASGDSLHTAVMTFAGMARGNGGTGVISKLVIIDKAVQSAAGELWLFDTAVTPAAANAAHSISDADAAHCVGVITFGPYAASALNSISTRSGVSLPYKCDPADTALYGILVTRGTPTYAASDLVVNLLASLD